MEEQTAQQLIDHVAAALSNGNFGMWISEPALQSAEPQLGILQQRLHLSQTQTILLVASLVLSKRDYFTVQNLAKFLHISGRELLSDLEILQQRGWLSERMGLLYVQDTTRDLLETDLYRSGSEQVKDLSERSLIYDYRVLQGITGWDTSICKAVNTWQEAVIYLACGLREARIGGRPALIRDDIDWSDFSIRRNTWLKEYLADYDKAAEYNNEDLIGEGYPPRDKGGNPYELHHIGQHPDSPLAELTVFEHRESKTNYSILHPLAGEIDRERFAKERSEYWRARFAALTPTELKQIKPSN